MAALNLLLTTLLFRLTEKKKHGESIFRSLFSTFFLLIEENVLPLIIGRRFHCLLRTYIIYLKVNKHKNKPYIHSFCDSPEKRRHLINNGVGYGSRIRESHTDFPIFVLVTVSLRFTPYPTLIK